ncbi:tRNA pseudouridine synthase A [Spirochaeta thermophila DSM 6578]|uniref:tRNA pseudouridine synthase A n=1 Tax=Winmispira thermophila (strain ATCC 700085 / DSM 6578 / Z-1203) TaxID=869211 RepID=G0GD58_WINT7|nr:tRNA pseudouridine(38-40) synthase TruA [Spirochaeta thermophila]AEJ62133.1 tRNA pseudouridine synthase A [Spirochaeta thermophila DSM 6578]
MGQRNIKVVLAYDGTDFVGWQRQPNGRSVQGVVEDALARMHKHPVHVHAAGRTDSGVHAVGQCINFITDIDSLPVEKFALALNSFLPRDVKALQAEEVPPDFHARYSAVRREYRYYVFSSPSPYPHLRRYSLWVNRLPDVRLLNAYASCIVGEHDFSSFCSPSDPSPSKVRLIHTASWFPEGARLVFRIVGNAFLWRMVRALVGTMLDLEKQKADPEMMWKILEARDRSAASDSAPAWGLFLHEVQYE